MSTWVKCSGLNSVPRMTCPTPNPWPVSVNLFSSRVFAVVNKIRISEWNPFGLIWDLTPVVGFKRERGGGAETQRHTEGKATWWWRQRGSVRSTSHGPPEISNSHRKLGERYGMNPSKRDNLANTLIFNFWPPESYRNKFLIFFLSHNICSNCEGSPRKLISNWEIVYRKKMQDSFWMITEGWNNEPVS